MAADQLAAARKVWAWLVGLVVHLGWKDRVTCLLLWDVYVRSSLLYWAPTFGFDFAAVDGYLSRNHSGYLEFYYQGLLCATLGLHHRNRNEVVYVLSGRLPLYLYIGKVFIRFAASLQDPDCLVARVVHWVAERNDAGTACCVSAQRLLDCMSYFPTVETLYVVHIS